MSKYEYTISLSITHPTIDPGEITDALKIEPSHSRKVGEKRATPKGRELDGVNRETFWRYTPQGAERLNSEDLPLEDYLEHLNESLAGHRQYIEKLVDSGGYIEYFIGCFGEGNVMATLSPQLMSVTSRLGIAIGFDIYTDD